MRAKRMGWGIPILVFVVVLFPIVAVAAADADEEVSERGKEIASDSAASGAKARPLPLRLPPAALGKLDQRLKFSDAARLDSVRGVAHTAGTPGGLTVSRHIEVNPDDVALGRCEGQTCVLISKGNYKGNRLEGGYLIPKKSLFFELPEGCRVTGVRLVNARFRDVTITDKAQKIRPGREPGPPLAGAKKGEEERPEPAPMKFKRQQQTERFFPAQTVSFKTLKGRKKTLVSVQFRPVLFQPSTERLVVVTEADVEVSYLQ